ncbi:MAG: hypothetical protein ABSG22_10590 [Sedimentisphaerales bacterium]|jgi:hypothetical protein
MNIKVTGTLAAGTYPPSGTYNGEPYYRRADGTYEIWFDSEAGMWKISSLHGVTEPACWYSYGDITGEYDIYGDLTGHPVVTYDAFTVTVTAGNHVTITPTGTVLVATGEGQIFLATPEAGYETLWTLDGTAILQGVNTYTISTIIANHTLTASAVAYRSIKAIVERGEISPLDNIPHSMAERTVITVKNDATEGILSGTNIVSESIFDDMIISQAQAFLDGLGAETITYYPAGDTLDVGQDKVKLALRPGETPTMRRITNIISIDKGMMTLEIR